MERSTSSTKRKGDELNPGQPVEERRLRTRSQGHLGDRHVPSTGNTPEQLGVNPTNVVVSEE